MRDRIRTGARGNAASRPAVYPLTRDVSDFLHMVTLSRRRTMHRLLGAVRESVRVEVDGVTYLAPTWDEHVGYMLYVKRKRPEFRMLQRAVALSPARGTFVDVGANVGTTTLPALVLHGFERAVCLEPEPRNVRLLTRAAALNGLEDRVEIVAAAAAAERGAARLRLHASNSGAHRLSEDEGVEIETVRLDDVCPDPASVGMVWMDVQGAEASVLRGAPRLLAAGVPLVCEIRLDRSPGLRALVSLLAESYRRVADLRERAPQLQPFSDTLPNEPATGKHYRDFLFLP